MSLPKRDNWRLWKTLSGLVWWVSVVADIWMAGSWFGVNNKDPSCLVSVAQAGCCDGLVWGLFCWSIFNLLISWTHIRMAAFSRIICYHEAQIVSNWFLTQYCSFWMRWSSHHECATTVWYCHVSMHRFHHLVESVPPRIKPVLTSKGGPTCKVYLMKWLVSLYKDLR